MISDREILTQKTRADGEPYSIEERLLDFLILSARNAVYVGEVELPAEDYSALIAVMKSRSWFRDEDSGKTGLLMQGPRGAVKITMKKQDPEEPHV